jgi:hypothetical protein
LIAGPLGLDFLNSLTRPIVEVVDWLGDGCDFLSWMRQAGLLTVDEIAVVKSRMSSEELDRVAAKARDLRDWLRCFVTEHMGRPLKAQALTQLGPVHDRETSDEVWRAPNFFSGLEIARVVKIGNEPGLLRLPS